MTSWIFQRFAYIFTNAGICYNFAAILYPIKSCRSRFVWYITFQSEYEGFIFMEKGSRINTGSTNLIKKLTIGEYICLSKQLLVAYDRFKQGIDCIHLSIECPHIYHFLCNAMRLKCTTVSTCRNLIYN